MQEIIITGVFGFLNNIFDLIREKNQLKLKMEEINANYKIEKANIKIKFQELENKHREKMKELEDTKKCYFAKLKYLSKGEHDCVLLLNKLILLMSENPQNIEELSDLYKNTCKILEAKINVSSKLLQLTNNDTKQLEYNL